MTVRPGVLGAGAPSAGGVQGLSSGDEEDVVESGERHNLVGVDVGSSARRPTLPAESGTSGPEKVANQGARLSMARLQHRCLAWGGGSVLCLLVVLDLVARMRSGSVIVQAPCQLAPALGTSTHEASAQGVVAPPEGTSTSAEPPEAKPEVSNSSQPHQPTPVQPPAGCAGGALLERCGVQTRNISIREAKGFMYQDACDPRRSNVDDAVRMSDAPLVRQVLANHAVGCSMTCMVQKRIILQNLWLALESGVPGDVVELGCHAGSTSILLQQLLLLYKERHPNSPKRQLHVYDSFEGLPAQVVEDENTKYYKKGELSVGIQGILAAFRKEGLPPPNINKGFFGNIPDDKYPEKIAFAFFDGDLYQTITDSFHKVFHKMSLGARALVHDFNWSHLPGAKHAVDDFLADKQEKAEDCKVGVGLVVKGSFPAKVP